MSRCESLFTHFAWEAVTPVKPLNSFLYLWLIFNYCFLLTIWLSYYTYVGLPDCPPHLLIFKKLYSSHCLFLSEFWVNSLSWSYNLLTGFSVMFSIAGHQYFAHEINFSRCWVFPFNEGIFLSNLLGSTWIGDFLRICLPHWPCCMNLGTRTDLLPVGSCCSWSSVTHLCPTSLLKKKKKKPLWHLLQVPRLLSALSSSGPCTGTFSGLCRTRVGGHIGCTWRMDYRAAFYKLPHLHHGKGLESRGELDDTENRHTEYGTSHRECSFNKLSLI